MGLIRRAGSRRTFTTHIYYFEVGVPTILVFKPPGRLQFMLYLWPFHEDGERRALWARGEWPSHWREKIKLANGEWKSPYPAPIFYWRNVGPIHVRYFRQLPKTREGNP